MMTIDAAQFVGWLPVGALAWVDGPGLPLMLWPGLIVLLVCVLGFGVFQLRRRREDVESNTAPEPDVRAGAAIARGGHAVDIGAVGAICASFEEWCATHVADAEPWSAFDQWVRETLTDQLGALRVRCFRVEPGAERLLTIAQRSSTPDSDGPSIRAGILGYVATSGREFYRSETGVAPLLEEIAQQTGEPWTWVWPVRAGQATIGVIAVGEMTLQAVLSNEERMGIGRLMTLCWQAFAGHTQLCQVRQTDHASGLLTRTEFFERARAALADSYRAYEPVVVVAISMEGLRGLDDRGHWSERDHLIEELGGSISARKRSDDYIGRFADDRFVVLLRRLDSGLGALIAEKILEAGRQCIARLGVDTRGVALRAGLAGSGLKQPELEALLSSAFEAVDAARRQGANLVSDLAPRGKEPEQP